MEQLNVLLAVLSGLASTAIIGVAKKLDVAVVSKLGNLTPALVLVLTYLLPKLTNVLHLTAVPDVTALTSAPLATIIAIACREAVVRLNPSAGATP